MHPDAAPSARKEKDPSSKPPSPSQQRQNVQHQKPGQVRPPQERSVNKLVPKTAARFGSSFQGYFPPSPPPEAAAAAVALQAIGTLPQANVPAVPDAVASNLSNSSSSSSSPGDTGAFLPQLHATRTWQEVASLLRHAAAGELTGSAQAKDAAVQQPGAQEQKVEGGGVEQGGAAAAAAAAGAAGSSQAHHAAASSPALLPLSHLEATVMHLQRLCCCAPVWDQGAGMLSTGSAVSSEVQSSEGSGWGSSSWGCATAAAASCSGSEWEGLGSLVGSLMSQACEEAVASSSRHKQGESGSGSQRSGGSSKVSWSTHSLVQGSALAAVAAGQGQKGSQGTGQAQAAISVLAAMGRLGPTFYSRCACESMGPVLQQKERKCICAARMSYPCHCALFDAAWPNRCTNRCVACVADLQAVH